MKILSEIDSELIVSEKQLRNIIPNYPKIMDKRICSELDHYCLELIELSTIAISGYSASEHLMTVLSKQDIEVTNSKMITISNQAATVNQLGGFASLYFLIPGVGHGLRVNGQVEYVGSQLIININTAYLHCARAAARSNIWNLSSSLPQTEINGVLKKEITPRQFFETSPYLLMKTMNEKMETEISPRGDSERLAFLVDTHQVFLPERPGNKVAISLRNIMHNNAVELLMLIPGSNLIMRVYGTASVTIESGLLDLAIVGSKRPKIGILLSNCHFSIEESVILEKIQPWLRENQIEPSRLTKFSKALSAHMNGEGLFGKVSTPVIDAIVKHDMRNLY
jgi:predicted pyridoxine 5'-phosphate oxidase superfamily flavin-nucleotide-binding protein